jgi:hypothetical protein
VHLDRALDLFVELFAAFDVFRGKPDPQLLGTHAFVEPPGEVLILRIVIKPKTHNTTISKYGVNFKSVFFYVYEKPVDREELLE